MTGGNAATHLILVPCHSVWDPTSNFGNEDNFGQFAEHWDLVSFQLDGHDHIAFIKHGLIAIKTQLKLLIQNTTSLVVFSGSQTSRSQICFSEAQSYVMLIKKLLIESQNAIPDCFIKDKEICEEISSILSLCQKLKITVNDLFNRNLVTTEEFALDSFQNLLFALMRFQEYVGQYPSEITIVGFRFKEKRFCEFHAKAIDFDPEKITYFSAEPNPLYLESLNSNIDYKSDSKYSKYFDDLNKSEYNNALKLFENDWYGIRGKLLNKRISRNFEKRFPNYKNMELLNFDSSVPDEQFYISNIKGKMPWSVKFENR